MDELLKPSANQTLYDPMQMPVIMLGYLVISLHHSTRIAHYHEIVYLETDDNYTTIYLQDKKSYMETRTLKSYEEELPGDFFFRCHRSFLVNIHFIREVNHDTGVVYLTNGSEILVARKQLPNLIRFLKEQKSTVYLVYNTAY
jgi:Response regulator of the LytR/AlgR family